MNKRKGHAALMMTLSLALLCAVGGLGTDLGWAYHEKQKAQGAAEAAVLAASSYANNVGFVCSLTGLLCTSNETQCTSLTGTTSLATACQYASTNGFTDGSNHVSVSMSSGTGAPPGTSGITSDYWVQATITENVFPMFSAILGNNRLAIQTIATAATIAGPGGGSIYVLGSGSGTVTTDGTAAVSSASEIWVNSTASDAVQVQGYDHVSCSGGAKVHVCGNSCSQSGHASISPAVDTQCANHPDPYSKMQAPSTSGCSNYGSHTSSWWDNDTLNPGIYSSINIYNNANVTMNPGTYYCTGDVNINVNQWGKVTGNGVTIYMASGKCTINNGSVTLTPPTSGTYKGVTIHQPASNTNQCTLTAGSSQTISGLVYAPGATVQHCGGSSTSAPNQTIVCNKLALTGGTNVNGPATTIYTGTKGALCR
jgi:Flp pilus assembly protein TadG